MDFFFRFLALDFGTTGILSVLRGLQQTQLWGLGLQIVSLNPRAQKQHIYILDLTGIYLKPERIPHLHPTGLLQRKKMRVISCTEAYRVVRDPGGYLWDYINKEYCRGVTKGDIRSLGRVSCTAFKPVFEAFGCRLAGTGSDLPLDLVQSNEKVV